MKKNIISFNSVPVFKVALSTFCLVLIGIFFDNPSPFFKIQTAYAQCNELASCGEPQEYTSNDQNVAGWCLEKCYKRTFNYNNQVKKIVVYYTENNGEEKQQLHNLEDYGCNGTNYNCSADGDCTPEDMAFLVANWTQDAWTRYLSYGFSDTPDSNDFFDDSLQERTIKVWIAWINNLGWCCRDGHYELSINTLECSLQHDAWEEVAQVIYHELWHAFKSSGLGNWIDEGTATCMADTVSVPVDVYPNSSFIAEARNYLATNAEDQGHYQSLTENDYSAALFWKYFMEQIGTKIKEPGCGSDAMKLFWDNLQNDGLATLDQIIKGQNDGQDLKSLWVDFTIANYAKDLSVSSVPEKYRYQDELQSGAIKYSRVSLRTDSSLPSSESNISINSWAAHYYEFRPNPSDSYINIQFPQGLPLQHSLVYTILLVRGADLISGQQFPYPYFMPFPQTTNLISLPNDSYDRVVMIVTSFYDAATYSFSAYATQSNTTTTSTILSSSTTSIPATTSIPVTTSSTSILGTTSTTTPEIICAFSRLLQDQRAIESFRSFRNLLLTNDSGLNLSLVYYKNATEISSILAGDPILRSRFINLVTVNKCIIEQLIATKEAIMPLSNMEEIINFLYDLKNKGSLKLQNDINFIIVSVQNRQLLKSIGVHVE